MRIWLLISGLLLVLPAQAQEWPQRWQACRDEAAPLVRLACYDALGKTEQMASAAVGTQIRAASWQAIWQQEQGRQDASPLFLLARDEAQDEVRLTRPALRGATLAIGCAHNITYLRVRLDAPGVGDEVSMLLDGRPLSGSWFVRDRGWLLEFGRGLPAIATLQAWRQHGQLTLVGSQGARLLFDLSGLAQALQPVREQCRW